MSRKNKTLRAFLHQTRNPTIEQTWDAAWRHAQKAFHARSMQDMEEKLADAQAECEKLRKDAERYRYIRMGNHWITAATQTGCHVDGENLDELIDSEMEQQK